jgi:threonine/homoserine/homoserine lactone efflux protein
MSVAQALAAFSIAAGILTIAPGLDTALVLRTAAVAGRRAAIMAGLGICLGCLCWGLGVAVGLGELLSASALAYNLLRAVGAGYLLFLGARLLIGPRRRGLDLEAPPGLTAFESPSRWFLRGLLTNLLNPKVGVFYLTFLPLFVPRGVGVAGFTALLASIHACQGALWFILLIRATEALTRWMRRPGVVTTLDRAAGVVLVGFGLRLALERR